MRLAYGLFILFLAATACKNDSEGRTEAADSVQKGGQEPAVKETPKEPKKAEPEVTCLSLDIPSYDVWIKDLSALRCDSCHNERIAFSGLQFLTYQDWGRAAEAAKIRIETNNLTTPLDPIEQGIFLKWFEYDMPRTEQDCVDKAKDKDKA